MEQSMPPYKKLDGEKCYLSPCSLEDAERWVEWFSDLEVTIPLGDEAYTPTSLEGEQEAIRDILENNRHVFSIVDQKTDRAIGRCMFFNVDAVNRTAMMGIVIGERDYWDQGYGQEAVSLFLDYGFNLLNLNSVMLATFSFNERAIRCYGKVGFKLIGRRREARIIAGERYDLILMDILAGEFESPCVKPMLATMGA
jgi:RimJ/RimL family protein N-acetyltransferase